MKKPFSLVYLTTPNCAPPEMIYMAARAGYDYVSLRTIPWGLPNEPNFGLAKNKALLRQTKRALDETGIKLHDTEDARIYDAVDLIGYLPEMEVAAELGARCLLTNIWTDDRNFVVEKFAELCDLAKPLGLTVILEFVTWASITNIKETLEVIKAAKRDNVGIVFDMLHFHRSRCSLEDLAAIPKEWCRLIHLCDAPGEIPTAKEGLIHTGRAERLYVGEGDIDIAAVVKRLPDTVYGIEVPNLLRAKEIGNAEHVWRCLETAKSYLDAQLQE